jgi:8-oxo-dGTP pyrophosphatase MutT (NUDIX family)
VESSCGVVLLNPRRELFMCRATGTHRWDLPKGVGEPNESARDAAVRETWEESGLRLPESQLHDLGEFAYLPGKRLHLFALRVALDAFDVTRCRCRSTFIHPKTKRPTPEVNGYAWKPVEEITEWSGKNMARVLGGLRWDELFALSELASLEVDVM